MYKQSYRPRYRGNNGGGNRARRIKTFDPSNIIGNTLEQEKEEVYVSKNKFSDFFIHNNLKTNIAARNYTTPTPIQDQAIPKILKGRDLVGIANTGTGKTAAFLIPLINKVLYNNRSRTLIIAPTRELALQIESELQKFSKNLKIHSTICIGGVSINPQISQLSRNPAFVIGTPGRLLDLESQRKINFAHFNSVVLDEVDRMLDMGFIVDIKKIVSKLPRNRQSLFFSATLNNNTKTIMANFLNNPELISVKSRDTRSNVDQKIIDSKGKDKGQVLHNILVEDQVEKTLVFVRTKRGADKLSRYLIKKGHRATAMHGNKSQNQRQRSLKEFKSSRIAVLIATDVASRGIDVTDITHVINYDLPESYEDYIHRIGRTGRGDKKGIALSLIY